jgi:uncharacterized cupredoxin-like copper-binding protein
MRASSLVAAVILVPALPALSVRAAETVVEVKMEDASINGSLEGMVIKLDRDTVKAGPVTFRVLNESEALVHELIVVQTDLDVSKLPYDPRKGKVLETQLKSLGEVEELKPGESGNLTLDLKPGPYLLMCNQPGHWHAGMWAKFTVTNSAT